jgi:hypothetical protein
MRRRDDVLACRLQVNLTPRTWVLFQVSNNMKPLLPKDKMMVFASREQNENHERESCEIQESEK